MWVDSGTQRLYLVANNALWIYSNAGTATGAVAPAAQISMNNLEAVQVDPVRDEVYCLSGSRLDVLANASALTGTPAAAPTRSVTGPATLLSNARSLFVDLTP